MGDFVWTADVVRWHADAAAHSDYYARLAERVRPHLPTPGNVLDAGCGTGALAVALSPYVERVTAMDRSPLALSALRGCPANVVPMEADAFSYEPAEPFDALLLCYFARPDEFLRLSRLCRGTAVLIADAHRSPAYEQALSERRIPFTAERFSLSFDQPLRSLAEAQAYAAHYGRPLARRTDGAEFPYCDEIRRDMALVRYPAGGRNEQAL